MRATSVLRVRSARRYKYPIIFNFPGQYRPSAVQAVCDAIDETQSGSSVVSLGNVRTQLIRQEDSIIFSLIERAQFLRNDRVYSPGGVPVPAYTPEGKCFTFLEYLLIDTEAVHGRIRRYTCPDEHAFFPDALPAMVRPCAVAL